MRILQSKIKLWSFVSALSGEKPEYGSSLRVLMTKFSGLSILFCNHFTAMIIKPLDQTLKSPKAKCWGIRSTRPTLVTRNEQVTRKLGLALFIDRKIVQLKMTAAATNASCLNSTHLSEILRNFKQTRFKLIILLSRKSSIRWHEVFLFHLSWEHTMITSLATIEMDPLCMILAKSCRHRSVLIKAFN